MKYQIKNTEAGIEIHVDDVETPAEQQQLLEAFQECQGGVCSCPTAEYKKLEQMQIQEDNGLITLRLMPKTGLELDQSELAACLEYTKSKVEGKK